MMSSFKYLIYLYNMHCAHVCACACFIDVRVWTRIQFALQDGSFQSKKGVIQYGLYSTKWSIKMVNKDYSLCLDHIFLWPFFKQFNLSFSSVLDLWSDLTSMLCGHTSCAHYTNLPCCGGVHSVLYTWGGKWNPRWSRWCHLPVRVYETLWLHHSVQQMFCDSMVTYSSFKLTFKVQLSLSNIITSTGMHNIISRRTVV